ncbi:CaiB/BaiF CoA-transferase family protein [Hymenobacter sp. M29]|uniref:CaiB/BaiF CoA-transferase family protein n=1 Tax=Hymenobacter mellowenesis TaxID=3063995 RepID=A0ABT9A8Q3_9BACT|nr:CaiB/BaiF CoA-transferase family protein [Hymenobacter sp. M29]MDO7846225.1 CaiB/BaiF CoA-transferase family protein [Hymenobacter sp. M29]
MSLPLSGLLVIEFSQFLAAPSAGLRLADLGARVIKIERPGTGEAGRQIAIKNLFVEGSSLVFHTINRNKESYAADLKNPDDLARVKQLLAQADVMTHNFRPGIMEKIGLGYDAVRVLNPRLIYGVVTGYGPTGPWASKPGQDLLIQSMSGLTYLSGTSADGPTPFGIAVADIICGSHFAQGLLAALVRRGRTGQGALVEVSLLESVLDIQFELLTTHLNDGGQLPRRGAARGTAHAYLSAPYGIYQTQDGHLALAMGNLDKLDATLNLGILADYPTASSWFDGRDDIAARLAAALREHPTAAWLAKLEPLGIWCAEVLNYQRATSSPGYEVLGMQQLVKLADGQQLATTRCPIRIDGAKLYSDKAAPMPGQDTAAIQTEFGLLAGVTSPPSPLSCGEGELALESTLELETSPPSPQERGLGGEVDARAKPLADLLVVDFSQFLSGPSAALRLADLGARVIKIERPETGDICRHLYTSNVIMNGESSVFHAINRNKESFAADLKNAADRAQVWELVRRADVVMHNYRPGVMERLGFDYASVKAQNPNVVYGEISGYGPEGPWRDKPGQDLLLQAVSGLTWLSGNADAGPVPLGLSIVDMLAGAHLAQGLLACLVRRSTRGEGGLAQVSMLESAFDFQFETLTTFFNDGGALPQRTAHNSAHSYLGAPYGIYQTSNGFLALAMGSIPVLGRLLGCESLLSYPEPAQAFTQRDEIKATLAEHLKTGTTEAWLAILEPADIWCANVLSWDRLLAHEGFAALNMVQEVTMADGYAYRTTRCPIRLDGELLTSPVGSPQLGQNNAAILAEIATFQPARHDA